MTTATTTPQFARLRFIAAWVLAVISIGTFAIGLLTPFFSLHPNFGEGFANKIAPHVVGGLNPQTYSILEGVWHLYSLGEWFIATLILVCSVVVPIVKLGALTWAAMTGMVRSYHPFMLRLLQTLGKWGMLDVLIVAVLVVAYRHFPGGTRVHVEIGLYFFAVSVLLSMVGGFLLPPRI